MASLKRVLAVEARLTAIEERLDALEGGGQAVVDEVMGDDFSPSIELRKGFQGKYNVFVSGTKANDEPLAKADAEALKIELEGEAA